MTKISHCSPFHLSAQGTQKVLLRLTSSALLGVRRGARSSAMETSSLRGCTRYPGWDEVPKGKAIFQGFYLTHDILMNEMKYIL